MGAARTSALRPKRGPAAMGKKKKKKSSSSSSSSDGGAPEPKAKAAPSGPRFNTMASDSEDEDKSKASFSKAGISTASASDAFNKAQWEMMEKLKVDYHKQTDKKFAKDEKKRKKVG